MEYYFLDDQLNQQYSFETQLGSIISYFTILAILIACLGLFGMASFTTERRTKEIGVRKTLGASVPGLVILLSKDFAWLVAVAFLMAAPIAYFVIDAWLQNFAYRTEIGVGTFIFTGILALLIALGTVSYQTIKAAMANPVESLRYE
jgi:putative ABC transport system permease protein